MSDLLDQPQRESNQSRRYGVAATNPRQLALYPFQCPSDGTNDLWVDSEVRKAAGHMMKISSSHVPRGIFRPLAHGSTMQP